jgi:addiction module HigA family antidote
LLHFFGGFAMAEYSREEVKRPPTHPGVIFAEDVMPHLREEKRTVGEIARLLDVSRQHLYKVMAGEMPITPDMAARIGKLVGNGAGIWLRLQAKYDTWEVTHRLSKELARIPTIG